MPTVEIPKRKFNIDVEGTIFVARELSVAYLQEAINNPEHDSADLAILDSIGEVGLKHMDKFGIDTKGLIYEEIIKFTYSQVLSAKDIKDIAKAFNITPLEIKSLNRSTKEQLKALLNVRINTKQAGNESQKKKSSIN